MVSREARELARQLQPNRLAATSGARARNREENLNAFVAHLARRNRISLGAAEALARKIFAEAEAKRARLKTERERAQLTLPLADRTQPERVDLNDSSIDF